MYDEGLQFCKEGTPGAFQDKQNRWRVRSKQLKPEVIAWRTVLTEAMGDLRWKWTPKGVTAAVILYESPAWLNVRREVRENDLDNKVKPALDAIQHATETPDELFWQLHVFKALSKRNRTTIFLYDLGDIVEHYY